MTTDHHSHVRLQDRNGHDLVTVSLEDGTVDVKDPEKLTDAARAFWDAIHTIRQQYTGLKDVVIKGAQPGKTGRAGDLILYLGAGGEPGNGGNILVYPPEESFDPERGIKSP